MIPCRGKPTSVFFVSLSSIIRALRVACTIGGRSFRWSKTNGTVELGTTLYNIESFELKNVLPFSSFRSIKS